MNKLDEIFQKSGNSAEYTAQYLNRVCEVIQSVNSGAMQKVIELVEQGIAEDRALICVANGGSSSVASHLVNDAIGSASVEGLNPFRVFSLSDNCEAITAISNDRGFENAYLMQMKAVMRPGDCVLAMSCSGNSKNLVAAMEWAKANGGKTIAWVGMNGGRLAELCEYVVHMPSTLDEYGPVEDTFSVLMHSMFTYIAMRRGVKLHH